MDKLISTESFISNSFGEYYTKINLPTNEDVINKINEIIDKVNELERLIDITALKSIKRRY